VAVAGAEPKLAWNQPTPVPYEGQTYMLRYGPELVPLPVTYRLDDFRTNDYPGSDMAMAYESDVGVRIGNGEWQTLKIWMNNPYEHGSWRVFQSGFQGDAISTFSVMSDPGYPYILLGCGILVAGLVVMFYIAPYSGGHPGIPVPGAKRRRGLRARNDAAMPTAVDAEGHGGKALNAENAEFHAEGAKG
ncbi:MAG: cytochrome c biogenesis protein ResB, partial [Phycisphaerales bacterium]